MKNWLNAEKGSWNTACTSRQYFVRSLPVGLVTSFPWKVTVPEVIGSSPSTIRAMVDFPDPLSPTIVVIWPFRRANETSLTAVTAVLPVPNVLVRF